MVSSWLSHPVRAVCALQLAFVLASAAVQCWRLARTTSTDPPLELTLLLAYTLAVVVGLTGIAPVAFGAAMTLATGWLARGVAVHLGCVPACMHARSALRDCSAPVVGAPASGLRSHRDGCDCGCGCRPLFRFPYRVRFADRKKDDTSGAPVFESELVSV